MPAHFSIIAVDRADLSEEKLHRRLHDGVKQFSRQGVVKTGEWGEFASFRAHRAPAQRTSYANGRPWYNGDNYGLGFGSGDHSPPGSHFSPLVKGVCCAVKKIVPGASRVGIQMSKPAYDFGVGMRSIANKEEH